MRGPSLLFSCIAVAVGLGTLCAASPVRAQGVITFDDARDQQSQHISNGYDNFNWDNGFGGTAGDWGRLDTASYSYWWKPNGYSAARVSGQWVAYGQDIGFSAPWAFNLNSMWLTSAWKDNLSVEVDGFLDGILTHSLIVHPLATEHTLYNFNWLDVDAVRLHASGGTNHPGFNAPGNYEPPYVAIDDITYCAPEGSSILMVAAGAAPLLGLPLLRRLRRKRAG